MKYGIRILRWILRKLKTSKNASLKPSFQKYHTVKDWQAHLLTLEVRLLMANLPTFYQLLNGLIDIDSTNFFVASTNTNSYKLKKNHILNIRDANMFHNRVINFWNKLPDSVVSAASISSFKQRLSRFVVNVGFEPFSGKIHVHKGLLTYILRR